MTQTVLLQFTVTQHTRTCTLIPTQTRVARQVAAPRPGMSLAIRSEGEERLWRARTSTSRSLSNIYVSLPFETVSHRCRGTGAHERGRLPATSCFSTARHVFVLPEPG